MISEQDLSAELQPLGVSVSPAEKFREFLSSRGLRMTRERAIVVEEIFSSHEHFDVRFLFRARDRALTASDEVLSARWVPIAEIEGFGTDESVLRAVRKLQAARAPRRTASPEPR